jgi:methylated-DNA-[protein]-cysteine S-methyltransferase
VAIAVKLSENRIMVYVYKIIASPVGRLELVARGEGLAAILWEKDGPKRVRLGERLEDRNHPILRETERQLGEYFAGERTVFTITLDMAGTEFQKTVWDALLTIPFGQTRAYAEIARQIGNPKAYRAMGAANGRNPVSIIVPCHRAIGSDGQLHGFAGGLDAKRYLLALERNRLCAAA